MKRALLWSLVAFATIAIASGYAVLRAGHWLEAPARQPVAADAIIILGGNDSDRSVRGLELYRAGYAPTIVLSGFEHGKGMPPPSPSWRAEYLITRGVPRSALRYEPESRNSYEEAFNVVAMMRKQGWRRVIVVSDPPHMRRLAWTWDEALKASDLDFVLVASAAEWWLPGLWWRNGSSRTFVINEYLKLAHYLVKP